MSNIIDLDLRKYERRSEEGEPCLYVYSMMDGIPLLVGHGYDIQNADTKETGRLIKIMKGVGFNTEGAELYVFDFLIDGAFEIEPNPDDEEA